MSVTISAADERDAEQILKLQFLCYQSEAELYGDYSIEPLTQTLAQLGEELSGGTVLVAKLGDEVVASVRGSVDAAGTGHIAKLIVHPRMRRHGLGGRLLIAIERRLLADGATGPARRFELFTGHRSEHNLRLYRKHGYEQVGARRSGDSLTTVTLAKPAGAGAGAGAYVTSA